MTEEETHDFTLILEGVRDLTGEVADAVFKAGCGDATLSMRSGVAYLNFSRVAPTRADAIYTAIVDAERSGVCSSAKLEWPDHPRK